ncbi:hypothetical protein [Serratia entomophila]|uniref:hypothetical protein n=1 Tax=Serratia entomophila TaxID=42906 RepID=UPI0021798419|nr:hypothetical protein [Serratia entomophila]CAI1680694.1 Uncharacterised protein [Serratia entomophila]
MKRILLAGMTLCCSCFAQARVDLEYHAPPPQDSNVPEEYRKKRDELRHKVWNVDNLTRVNEQALARERQHEAAEANERHQRHLAQQQKQQRCLRVHSKDPHRQAACFTAIPPL